MLNFFTLINQRIPRLYELIMVLFHPILDFMNMRSYFRVIKSYHFQGHDLLLSCLTKEFRLKFGDKFRVDLLFQPAKLLSSILLVIELLDCLRQFFWLDLFNFSISRILFVKCCPYVLKSFGK